MRTNVVCIGAGPAGLTAAYELSRNGREVVVLEADPVYVGGIARTHLYKGFRFDIGGHRFYSKSKEIESLWTELLPHDFLQRPRSSKILYRKKFLPYPLKLLPTFFHLGPLESVTCVLSYLKARMNPHKETKNFEQWIVNRFGRRLFEIFFRRYTEKVWGKKCMDISADWAEQRIQDFSFSKALRSMLIPSIPGFTGNPKTLITTFRYPRLGPGMLWEAAATKVREQGGRIEMGAKVVNIIRLDHTWKITYLQNGIPVEIECKDIISSMPISSLCRSLSPSPKTLRLAEKLEYRDFIIVALITKSEVSFSDQWLYIHDERVKTCRVQNFRAWSPELLPTADSNCLGLEYFCNESDELWSKTDQELIELARSEAGVLGLLNESSIVDACVVRRAKAYPVYSNEYNVVIQEIGRDLEENFPGLHLAGRNGMHRYNNQDHAMMTALLTARNIIAAEKLYDPWKVDQDAGYFEENE